MLGWMICCARGTREGGGGTKNNDRVRTGGTRKGEEREEREEQKTKNKEQRQGENRHFASGHGGQTLTEVNWTEGGEKG